MKTSIKYSILIILTFFNIQFLYILTFIPFPFFGWITLFILSCIWVYLSLRFCVWSINRIFKKNIRVKKLYLALPYPLIMLSWFGFSFVPLEWQPSFREFERLCKTIEQPMIYNAKTIINLWDTYKQTNKNIQFQITKNYINLRTTQILIEWYYDDNEGKKHTFKIDKDYSWYDIGMIPKNERTLTCASIDKTKELIKQRWWLK